MGGRDDLQADVEKLKWWGVVHWHDGAHAYSIGFTEHRAGEPHPMGKWLGERLLAEPRFEPLLTELRWNGGFESVGIPADAIDPALSLEDQPTNWASILPDYRERLTELLDAIEAHRQATSTIGRR